eukprot:TRINITY_DN4256_c0_g1_i4.p1 TRINITY_DN4256_c0_g1~~TRINITY_DN4256_c0_g1_i4.p1  ORF type:complete len:469 (-),score=119.42 TRINITY_DN4256_c0_g1_i4:124-1530(-)
MNRETSVDAVSKRSESTAKKPKDKATERDRKATTSSDKKPLSVSSSSNTPTPAPATTAAATAAAPTAGISASSSVSSINEENETAAPKPVAPPASSDTLDKATIEDIIAGLSINIHTFSNEKSTNSELKDHDYKYQYQVLVDRSDVGSDFLKFKHFAPKVFSKIRSHFGISGEQYLRSFSLENLIAVKGEGKSGAFFIFTKDKQFVLKTTTGEERDFLLYLLPLYWQHLQKHPNSLLPRFYGVYSFKHKGIGGVTRFVIMNNVFNTPLELEEKYDLKGSTVGRATTNFEKGAIRKDMDIKSCGRKLHLPDHLKEKFVAQLEIDSNFLGQHNVMDYSLLLGIHYETPENKEKTQSNIVSLRENTNRITTLATNDFQKYHNGMVGKTPEGRSEVYYVGIIDVLIKYAAKKKMEHFVKSFAYAGEEVSVVAPNFYKDRFYRFISDLVISDSDQKEQMNKDESSGESEGSEQ